MVEMLAFSVGELEDVGQRSHNLSRWIGRPALFEPDDVIN
ncbi:hypothetical protein BOO71_0012778 [Deinococcus marmoris]|uniref:Uncharacterized protein n=1 Tax=Deinococcus marmoris TaxID=249408 RepID=A0A1U7NT83_9DEIO|nr:hypothetical protein BOO71_0012778 [Deinococcus marmoris]